MNQDNEFQQIGNPFTVIVSNSNSNNNFVKSSEDAVELLKGKYFSEILVARRGMLNSFFMQKGLVDEIYLDIEPFLFYSKSLRTIRMSF